MTEPGRKVLLVTLEPITAQMAGPAIRAVELARQLAFEHSVTVFTPRKSDLPVDWAGEGSFKLVSGLAKQKFYSLAATFDVLFVQANVLKPYPGLARLDVPLAVDLYDPYLLSVLAQYANDEPSAAASYSLMHQVLEKHMTRADFSVCASERQRDYWIGRYCALGRLTPEIYRLDPSFRKLIDVVPFGLPETAPARTGAGMKGRVPGILAHDFVILWGGGIWEWFDPLTVIEAVAAASKEERRLKLFFMGWKSPNPQVEIMPMALRARELAQSLGVLDTHVFFGSDWIAYDERVNYLLDADVAVSAHFDLPETRFSFRTRVLDYLWCGLPILATEGDHLAEQIQLRGAGRTLPYKDVDAWAQAIIELSRDPQNNAHLKKASSELAREFRWSLAVEPLRAFCRNPHRLPPFERIKMPSIIERAQAVYSRGGKDLVLRRSKDIIQDMLRH